MSNRNPVIWREGLFIKPQHFQQQQRHVDYMLHAKISVLGDYCYGVQSLRINPDYLGFGRIALISATGILPDGTLFNIPDDDELPPPLEITAASAVNQIVYLALPLMVNGSGDVALDESGKGRMRLYRHEVRDLHSQRGDVASLDVARITPRLMLEREERGAYSCLAIARIQDLRPDGGVVLDPGFMPCALCIAVISSLKRFVDELTVLVAERARAVSLRIAAPTQQGVADVAEFMMLQLLNRIQPLLAHLSRLEMVHPERLHATLVQLAGELMTFTDESRLAAEFPAYCHTDPQRSFEPVMRALRQALSTVLSPRALSIQLRKQQYGISVAVIQDSELLSGADFVLAVRARLPQEQLRKQLLQQIKVASSDKLRDLISLQLPGVPLLPLPVAPRQLPYHAGYSYFQIDRQSPAWQMLINNNTLAFHIAGDFPELELQLWAIRSH